MHGSTSERVVVADTGYDRYTDDMLSALRLLRRQLNTRILELQQEVDSLHSALRSYRDVGSEFKHVADQYLQVQKAIEEEQWALGEATRLKMH